MDRPAPENRFQAHHAALLLASYRHWTGRSLIEQDADPAVTAQRLFQAPFVVVSHGPGEDPCFDYGNIRALELFEMDWDRFTRLPSRHSAEPLDRARRAELLRRVARDGFIDNYRGVRISASGRRFLIEGAVVWNLLDPSGRHCGQAATFGQWTRLPRQPS